MKTHRFDGLSFIAGLIITLTGLVFLFTPDATDIFDLLSRAGVWFWPVVLVTIGLAILIPALIPKSQDAASVGADSPIKRLGGDE